MKKLLQNLAPAGAVLGLSAVALGVGLGTANSVQAQTVVDTILSLVVDGSGSIGSTDYGNQLNAYADVFDDDTFYSGVVAGGGLGQIAANFIQFSNSAVVEVPLTLIDSQAASDAFALAIRGAIPNYIGGGTSIAAGINLCSSTVSGSGFTAGGASICDVSTDGQANAAATSSARDAALAGPIDRINAIGIGSGVSQTFLQTNVQGGPDSFTIVTPDFDAFRTAISNKITREITDDQDNQSVPEPGTILGLFAIGGLGLAAKLKKQPF